MRLHPVSWLLIGVLSFTLWDAVLQIAWFAMAWKSLARDAYDGGGPALFGMMLSAVYRRIGAYALDTFVWIVGTVVWLEVLWRTLRGLRLRRVALETMGVGERS